MRRHRQEVVETLGQRRETIADADAAQLRLRGKRLGAKIDVKGGIYGHG